MSRHRLSIFLCFVVLAVCLVLSFFVWKQAIGRVETVHLQQFRHDASDIQNEIENRVNGAKHVLYGGRALFESTTVNRQLFQQYVASLDMAHHFPGVSGFAFIRVVPASQTAALVATMKQEGSPSFTIHPVGKRSEYAPIVYTAPTTSPISPVIGFDAYSDPVRIQALSQAKKTHDIAITDKVILTGDNASLQQYSFLMYLPVFVHGELFGYVYVPSRFKDLLAGLTTNTFDIHIIDVTDLAKKDWNTSLFSKADRITRGHYMTTIPIAIGSRMWLLDVQTTKYYDNNLPGDNIPHIVLVVSIVLSLLLFLFLYFLATQRRRALRLAEKMTAELRDNEQKYRTIFETLQDVYYETDSNGIITTVSPSIEQYTGIPASVIVGTKATAFYTSPKEREHLLETLQKDGYIFDYEVTLRGKENKPLAVSVTAKVLHNTDGKIRGVGGMLRDITRRKHAEEALKRKNDELEKTQEELDTLVKKLKDDKKKLEEAMTKDEFLSMAAHELRTPLGTMRWRIETMLSKKLSPTLHEDLEKNYHNVLRLIDIVNNLLDVSRMNQHTLKENPEMIDVVSLAEVVIDSLEERMRQKDIHFTFQKPATIPLFIDQNLLEEILVNILSNAVKYNKEHGKITLELVDKKDAVDIIVSDTGIGIPKKDQKTIFEKFKRASNVDPSTYDGTGLGLFVVKSYVLHWKGRITLTSKENKGTTITIEIPIKQK